jgi:hypothetical protein
MIKSQVRAFGRTSTWANREAVVFREHGPVAILLSDLAATNRCVATAGALDSDMSGDGNRITRLMELASTGDKTAADRLLPLVYDELRRAASQLMAAERPDHTLQATALVHEAYIRLVGDRRVPWANRAHFYTAAGLLRPPSSWRRACCSARTVHDRCVDVVDES